MKEYRDEILTARYDEQYIDVGVFKRMAYIAKGIPQILSPIRGGSKNIMAISSGISDNSITWFNALEGSEHLRSRGIVIEREPLLYIKGFHLIPTVARTTLFYEEETDCFIKIIHPVKVKDKFKGLFFDKAEYVCRIAGELRRAGLMSPQIVSYGRLEGMRYFYLMKRIEGVSLNYLCLHRREEVTVHLMKSVMSILARFHMERLWHGDLRPSHLFICRDRGLAIIDIDSIRKPLFLFKKHMAKDIAGINHPSLPLSLDERLALFNHYAMESGLRDIKRFLALISHYSERRWRLKALRI